MFRTATQNIRARAGQMCSIGHGPRSGAVLACACFSETPIGTCNGLDGAALTVRPLTVRPLTVRPLTVRPLVVRPLVVSQREW